MFDFTIIAVGKLKEKYWQEAFSQYQKRLSPYAKVKVVEISHQPFGNAGDKERAIRAEGEKILAVLKKRKDTVIFVLSEDGEQPDSRQLAEKLRRIARPIIFIIGGALGLSEEVKKAGQPLSLSKLTFTHEMARIILLEQLYRAIAIIKDKDYHY